MIRSSLYWLLEPEENINNFFVQALIEAQAGMGTSHPNPSVGAVIEKNGQVLAKAHTQPVGGFHAEKFAIALADKDLRGANLYVSLEPCSHFGRTPPCTDQIIKSGIKKVIYGVQDPNPLVAGKGIEALRSAGIKISQITDTNLVSSAQALLKPFSSYILSERPYVILKIAISADHKISQLGKKTQISGPESQVLVHRMRLALDAVMVGANTVKIDNPELTARLIPAPNPTSNQHQNPSQNRARQPIRIVLSSQLDLDLSARIFDSKTAQTWVITGPKADHHQAPRLAQLGVKVLSCSLTTNLDKQEDSQLDLAQALKLLAKEGITSLLVEPGAELLASFLKAKLADEIWCFKSPQTIGPRGLSIDFDPDNFGLNKIYENKSGKDFLSVYLSGANNF